MLIFQLPRYSAYSSCTTHSPVLIFPLPSYSAYYSRTTTSATQLLCVLKLCYQVASSHLPTPQLLRVLQSYYHVASSQLPAPQLLRVLKLYYKVASSPQLAPLESHSRLRFAHSTRTISAEGRAVISQIALLPAFRALDTHDLRRRLRGHPANRTLACISHIRHARSPQRVARAPGESHSRLHFAHSTRTISAEGSWVF